MNKLVQTRETLENGVFFFPIQEGLSAKGVLSFSILLLFSYFYNWVKPATLSATYILLHVSFTYHSLTFTFLLYKFTLALKVAE
jgi:hypothetical protein